ncbi:DUF11 domain-containing protein [Romboutsia sp.]|uniref:DUF11 domain-containing protein n=1 Tax=Romboutsia sp. TaxID=1965302 RepID=UPI003F3A0340
MTKLIKSSNVKYVNRGDVITYTIVIDNTDGDEMSNIVLTDEPNTRCTIFIPDSITLNGVTQVSQDPIAGISIGRMPSGSISTVTFKEFVYCCDTIINNTATLSFDSQSPIQEPIHANILSNTVKIYSLLCTKLDLSKSSASQTCNINEAAVGDIITYMLIATNKNSIQLDNVTVTDTLTSDLSFIKDSVKIDNVKSDEDIRAGVNVGTIHPNSIKTITFEAKIVSKPSNGIISNKSFAEYSYIISSDLPARQDYVQSNISNIYVKNPSVKVIKTADKKVVSIGDTINYKIQIINDGDIDLVGVVFKDDISSTVSLIKQSFMVDNISIDLAKDDLIRGIKMPIIRAANIVIITYQVKVISSNCKAKILNIAHVDCKYILPGGCSGTIESLDKEEANSVIDMNMSTFKQASIDKYFKIPEYMCEIESINHIEGKIEISTSNVIETQEYTSNEGQKLNKYKLIVKGVLKTTIEYTANEPTQSVLAIEFKTLFSQFLILPLDYVLGSNIEVEGIVEDISYNLINSKEVFNNATILIAAKILSC